MTNTYHIARNTFREAVREKVLYIILAFGLALVLASKAIGWISVGQQIQVVKDFSLAVISLFSALIAVFVGTSLIYKETDKRTIYTILSKPVHRYEFVLGKFFGLYAVILAIIGAMGVLVTLFIAFGLGGGIDRLFLQAIGMIGFEMLIITAIAMLFSTASSPVLSAVFTFSAYLVGQVTEAFVYIAEKFSPVPQEHMANPAVDVLSRSLTSIYDLAVPLSKALYYILPNLSHFSLRNRVVYGPPLIEGELMTAIVYAAFYTAMILGLAVLSFQKKRF